MPPPQSLRSTQIAVGTAVVLALDVAYLTRSAEPTAPPRTGALTAPEKLTLEYRPALTIAEKTTLRLSANDYIFGPGRHIVQDDDPTSADNPLVLGLGSRVFNRHGYRVNTEFGVGKMLDRQDFTLGETLTLFSNTLTRSLTQNLDLNAGYNLLNGATTRSQDWSIGLQYRIGEQVQWQLQHREINDQTGQGASDRVTRMEYRVQF